jgi:hypothetical protein
MNTIKFIPDKDQIPDSHLRITVYYFLTDTCIIIIKFGSKKILSEWQVSG